MSTNQPRKVYPTDLDDNEWHTISPLMPKPAKTGRPRKHTWREILNAIFYATKNGCLWRALPHDFPPWRTVYRYFRKWRIDGTWERLNRVLREQLREKLGRNKAASAAIVDSQSVKTVEGEKVAPSVAMMQARMYGVARGT